MKNRYWGWTSRFFFWIPGLLALSLTIFLAACAPAATQSPTPQGEGPRDNCGFIEPSNAEVQKILSVGKSLFTSPDWVKSYTVEPYKITVSRNNDKESAVAYTEYLIYTCGYTQEDMNKYFNDAGFNTIFSGYESHNMANFCENKGLALYKFDLVDKGTDYIANYWVKQQDDTHILVMMLVFPRESSTKLDEYSAQIFPELTHCP